MYHVYIMIEISTGCEKFWDLTSKDFNVSPCCNIRVININNSYFAVIKKLLS